MPWKRLTRLTKREAAEAVREGKRKTRFLVDESVDVKVAEGIRRAGWNALHAQECGLKGHPDENLFAYARREDRIIITHDPDFLDDRRFPPAQNPGIIVIPGAEGSVRALNSALNAVLRIVGDNRDLWRETKIRITPDGTWTLVTFDRDAGQQERQRYRFERGRPVEYWEDAE